MFTETAQCNFKRPSSSLNLYLIDIVEDFVVFLSLKVLMIPICFQLLNARVTYILFKTTQLKIICFQNYKFIDIDVLFKLDQTKLLRPGTVVNAGIAIFGSLEIMLTVPLRKDPETSSAMYSLS